jgi:hypothetical protein
MQSSDKPTTFQGVPIGTQPSQHPKLPDKYTSLPGPSPAARAFPSPPTTALPQAVDPALVESLLQSLRQQDSHQQHQQQKSSRKTPAHVSFFKNDYDYGDDSDSEGNGNKNDKDDDDDEYLPLQRKIYRGSIVHYTGKQPSAFFSSPLGADSLYLPYQGDGAQAFFQSTTTTNNNEINNNNNLLYYSQGGAAGGLPLSPPQSTPQKRPPHVIKGSSQPECKEEVEDSDSDSDESDFEASFIKKDKRKKRKKKDEASFVPVPGDSTAVFMRAPRRSKLFGREWSPPLFLDFLRYIYTGISSSTFSLHY